LVGTITTTAIIRYDVDAALKMWSALGTLVGLLTGVIATHYFEGQITDDAKSERDIARKIASERLTALRKAAEIVGQPKWDAALAADPELASIWRSA
jgi:hypothetical protein